MVIGCVQLNKQCTLYMYACTTSHIIMFRCVDLFSLQYPSQELLNVRDDLERQRQELTEELGRVEEQKIACLRETEETRQALVEADGHCTELQTQNSLLEGQVLCRVLWV